MLADLSLEYHGVFGDELVLLRVDLPRSTHALSLRLESCASLGPTRDTAKHFVNSFKTYLYKIHKTRVVVYFEYVLEYLRAWLSQLVVIILK